MLLDDEQDATAVQAKSILTKHFLIPKNASVLLANFSPQTIMLNVVHVLKQKKWRYLLGLQMPTNPVTQEPPQRDKHQNLNQISSQNRVLHTFSPRSS